MANSSSFISESARIELDRRRRRSVDIEMALGLQLEHARQEHEVDAIVVTDMDGAPVASAGDEVLCIELAQFAAASCKQMEYRNAISTSRGLVLVDQVLAGPRTFLVAASAGFDAPHLAAMERCLEGVRRIFSQGFSIAGQAPIPLVVEGSWGNWD